MPGSEAPGGGKRPLSLTVRYAPLSITLASAHSWTAIGRKGTSTQAPRLFDWTFGRNDLWDEEGYSFALHGRQGRTGGHAGGHSVCLQWDVIAAPSGLPTTWSVRTIAVDLWRCVFLDFFTVNRMNLGRVWVNSRVVPIYHREWAGES